MTETLDFGQGGAWMSTCGLYRYTLDRQIGGTLPPWTIVMLNPSTADATKPDPTLRRCVGFAKRANRRGIHIVNLFAYRTPYPIELKRAHDAGIDVIGPQNRAILDHLPGPIVCAWGPPKWRFVRERIAEALRTMGRHGEPLYCLGTADDGSPRHPLMLPNETELSIWTPKEKP